MTSLLVDVVRREPLGATDGRSGGLLEGVVLAGGETLVVKHVRAGGDWIMPASHDHGRAAQLWSEGVLGRVPEVIDHAVLGAEQVSGGWMVIMRDVSAGLVLDDRLSRQESRRSWRRPRPCTPGSGTSRRFSCARWSTAPSSSPRPRPAANATAPTRSPS